MNGFSLHGMRICGLMNVHIVFIPACCHLFILIKSEEAFNGTGQILFNRFSGNGISKSIPSDDFNLLFGFRFGQSDI